MALRRTEMSEPEVQDMRPEDEVVDQVHVEEAAPADNSSDMDSELDRLR